MAAPVPPVPPAPLMSAQEFLIKLTTGLDFTTPRRQKRP